MTQQSLRRRNSMLLGAAIAACCTLGASQMAMAQYQAGQTGHANDASNRVGSGGQNGGRPMDNGVTGNDIVNRNVTAGREFRGPILEKDPRAFTGPAAGTMVDIFTRQTNGVPTDYGAEQGNLNQAQVYYGDSRYTPPPIGSLPLGYNGGYIGTGSYTPSSLSSGFNTSTYLQQMQARTTNRDTYLLDQAIATGNTDALSNSLYQSGTLNTAPIYGLHTLSNGIDTFNMELPDHFAADNGTIMRMRQELRDSAQPNPNAAQPNSAQPTSPVGLNQPLNRPLGQAFDAPSDAAVNSQLSNSQIANSPLSSTGNIPTGPQAAPSLIPPEMQSPLLMTLQQRLERTSDVEKSLADWHAAHPQPAQPAQPAKPNDTGVQPPGPAQVATQTPIVVKSLAEGIRAKGLHDLMAGAEDLIHQGKYDQAIQQYNQAQRVAPNNPLIALGRAQAELGGGYYARAELDLRTAFGAGPQLMLMQFDLDALLPKDRIAYLRKDLQDLAKADPKLERPWFVMAYLDYNSGFAAAAESDLREAESRGSRADMLIKRLQKFWTASSQKTEKPAPAPAPAPLEKTPELNK